MNALFGMTALLVSSAAFAVPPPAIPLNFDAQKDASQYAANVAASISDRPECQVHRQKVLSHANEKLLTGNAMQSIVLAKQKARMAGCVR